MKKLFLILLSASTSLVACSADDTSSENDRQSTTSSSTTQETVSSSSALQWSYNKDKDVYYITGLIYCDTPADKNYEQMAIFVPGAYMNATASGSTYTCSVNTSGTKNGFTAETAPIVFPVNTPGYKAQSPLSSYSSNATSYTDKGFIYLHAGCRGKDAAAPSGVTDLKAALRYFRFLAANGGLPGNTERIYSFGHSGGGAQSALLGTTGNSSLYDVYLNGLGAKMDYKDHVNGSMCWCPITNLDQGNGAYEWNMGLTRSSLSETDQNISKALAASFARYINAIGLKHPTTGETLTLEATADGYYQSGSYYEYMMEFINDAVSRYNQYNGASVATYSTTDASALSDFAKTYKSASKGLGAFDAYDGVSRTSAGNLLFDPAGEWSHFDKYLAEIVGQYASQYKSAFDTDLAKTDKYGNNLDTRLAMYTPLYYLLNNSTYYSGGGKGSSNVASHWRIRTGIKQDDTSLCTELNLALGLLASGISDVDFATIWGQGHTQAEDTGNGTDNFIEWVEKCCQSEAARILETKAVESAQTTGIYSLSGQRLSSAPENGIYIEDGVKKFK